MKEARRWYRQAIDSGHEEVAAHAASELRDLDRRQQRYMAGELVRQVRLAGLRRSRTYETSPVRSQ
jgi:hypothetical protein